MKRQPRRDARDPYRDYSTWEDREQEFEARPVWTSSKWALAVMLGVLAIAAILWGIGVAVSGPKGAGDVHRANESALNRIQQQGDFVQLREDYTGALAKITAAKAAVKAAKRDPKALPQRQVELDGLAQNCVDIAQQYNADGQKVLARDWKDSGLPSRLDPARCAS